MQNNNTKLYLNLHNGATGEMLVAALFELIDNKESVLRRLNDLNIEGLRFIPHKVENESINGTYMKIINDSKFKYEKISLKDVVKTINNLALEENIRNDVLGIYYEIAKAQCTINKTNMKELYFRQLGSPEAIGSVASICYLINILNIDEIRSTPISIGNNERSNLIILELLKGLPYIIKTNYDGELTSPIGAALIKVYTNKFIDFKHTPYIKQGNGISSKSKNTINYLSAFLVR